MTAERRRRRGADHAHRDAARGQGDGSTPDLDALARLLAPRVALALAAILAGAAQPMTYTTRKEGPRPPEFPSHRAWRECAPRIPGAVRIGRWVSVSRSAFERWRDAKGTTEPTRPAATERAEWSPAKLAEDLGLRVVSGGSK